MNKNCFDVHEELLVQRIGQGIHLVNPDKNNHTHHTPSIENLMKAPFHMFFMDKDSVLKKFNERGVMTFNLYACEDAIGLSARDICSKETAESSIANDKTVLQNKQFLICDESYIRHDDSTEIRALSMKFPWYDHTNTIIGIFGLSFLLDEKWGISLASAMNQITQTGLLDARQTPSSFSGFQYGEIYFSKRQKEIISHLIRGKTAKEIAFILELSTRTVEHHIENIKFKTDSSSKSELIDKVIDFFI